MLTTPKAPVAASATRLVGDENTWMSIRNCIKKIVANPPEKRSKAIRYFRIATSASKI